MDTIVFAAGGTGGHIIPALATARYCKKIMPNVGIIFVGSGGELERRLMKDVEFEYLPFDAQAIIGRGYIGLLNLLKRFPLNILKILKMFKINSVRLVIGFGGYPSFIPAAATRLVGIPCFVFEQNAKIGLANKILALVATQVFAVPGANGFFRKEVTRVLNPVRDEFKKISPWRLPRGGTKIRILVVGGSQGAVSLNSEIMKLRDFIAVSEIELIHQTGAKDFPRVNEYYSGYSNIRAKDYIEDMAESFNHADLVICRAGAGAIAEITQAKRPAIFVPLAISQGHQKYNALHLVKGGAAVMCEQSNNLNTELKTTLQGFLEDRNKLQIMHEAFLDISELNGVYDGAEVISLAAQKILEIRK